MSTQEYASENQRIAMHLSVSLAQFVQANTHASGNNESALVKVMNNSFRHLSIIRIDQTIKK